MPRPIGTLKQLRRGAMAIGLITILTGQFQEIDTGARPYQSGAVRISMNTALGPWLN